MMDDTSAKHLGGFLQKEFSRISGKVSQKVCKLSGLTPRSYVNGMSGQDIERVYNNLQKMKIMAPPTNCLAPIGAEQILSGLLQGVKSEFYSASTRPPSVYRGNPFQIEVGLAYGGNLGPDKDDREKQNGKKSSAVQARIIRFANRVPLLYQQSACCMYKSVIDMNWGNYGISQSRGALPSAPLLIMVHMASVWVPFTSEAKEAIANYDEIRKEIRLGIQECGRRLGTLLKRKKKQQAYVKRRDVFTRYIDEVVNATRAIKTINKETFKNNLLRLARKFTTAADMQFDEHGKIIGRSKAAREELEHTLVVELDAQGHPASESLFGNEPAPKRTKKKPVSRGKKKKAKKNRSKKSSRRKR